MKTACIFTFKGDNGVCIALKAPAGHEKLVCYPPLFPKWSFLKRYLTDKDEVAYTKAYQEQVLSKLDAAVVWGALKDSVLLCWEPAGHFCHRRLVADWVKRELGHDVEELFG